MKNNWMMNLINAINLIKERSNAFNSLSGKESVIDAGKLHAIEAQNRKTRLQSRFTYDGVICAPKEQKMTNLPDIGNSIVNLPRLPDGMKKKKPSVSPVELPAGVS